jgi:pfkB family carbohydrate kinase
VAVNASIASRRSPSAAQRRSAEKSIRLAYAGSWEKVLNIVGSEGQQRVQKKTNKHKCTGQIRAGGVFHGAFCYSVLKGASLRDALEFSNAMAALNCTKLGARGGIASEDDARGLIERGERRSHCDFIRNS